MHCLHLYFYWGSSWPPSWQSYYLSTEPSSVSLYRRCRKTCPFLTTQELMGLNWAFFVPSILLFPPLGPLHVLLTHLNQWFPSWIPSRKHRRSSLVLSLPLNQCHTPFLSGTYSWDQENFSLTFLTPTPTSAHNPLAQEEGWSSPLLQHHILVLSKDSKLNGLAIRGGHSCLIVLKKKLHDLVYQV